MIRRGIAGADDGDGDPFDRQPAEIEIAAAMMPAIVGWQDGRVMIPRYSRRAARPSQKTGVHRNSGRPFSHATERSYTFMDEYDSRHGPPRGRNQLR